MVHQINKTDIVGSKDIERMFIHSTEINFDELFSETVSRLTIWSTLEIIYCFTSVMLL